MGFTALIDVAIGLALLYLGASLFVTVANEFIGQLLNLRAKQLGKDLEALLDLGQVRSLVPQNPSFQGLADSAGRSKSYADPVVVAQSMIGTLRTSVLGATKTMQEVAQAIDALPPSRVREALLTVSQGSHSVERFADDVAQWVDRSLKVMGEGYKRLVQWISLGLGLIVAIAFNIDTVSVTVRLYNDKDLRERAVASAEALTKALTPEQFKKCQEMSLKDREAAVECKPMLELRATITKREAVVQGLPIGWDGETVRGATIGDWAMRLFGWLLTALAISIGAPFWFDLLNRFVNVRHAIRRPEPERS